MATRNSPRKGPPMPLAHLFPSPSRRQKNTHKTPDTADIKETG